MSDTLGTDAAAQAAEAYWKEISELANRWTDKATGIAKVQVKDAEIEIDVLDEALQIRKLFNDTFKECLAAASIDATQPASADSIDTQQQSEVATNADRESASRLAKRLSDLFGFRCGLVLVRWYVDLLTAMEGLLADPTSRMPNSSGSTASSPKLSELAEKANTAVGCSDC